MACIGRELETMRIERRFIAALLIIIMVVGAGVIISSVPLNRTLFSSDGMDPPFHPDYLLGNFTVTEADTGNKNPILKVSVDLNRNEEYVDFIIQFLLLNLTLEQFEQVSNISALVGDDETVAYFGFPVDPPPTVELTLPNIPCTYLWVLWIEVESIPETWTLDLSLTLEFSIL